MPLRRLRGAQDIDAFIADLLEAGWEYTSAAVYAVEDDSTGNPDHEMIVGADKETGLGAVRYSGGEEIPGDDATEWFSVGDRVNPDGVEFAYFGTGHDFPANSEVSLDLVKQAMRELLASGGKRPSGVDWQARG
ncbi:Imm1 family immunity protein [Alloactinosynnema sp. L-07]|uniref:Imm1 family immunity protein n=1 Tax=Alloactinosynnema sp. L-07 TaxID=1653480 RepID=UPI0015609795|nr:Imm1 family immunity protein [Alloactinosynnema sp. L-07]